MWVLSPHVNIAKEEENPMCVLSPHVGNAIEEEEFSMCFGSDMKVLYTLYLSNNKLIKRMGIASLILMGF